jgi:hypothetical protein
MTENTPEKKKVETPSKIEAVLTVSNEKVSKVEEKKDIKFDTANDNDDFFGNFSNPVSKTLDLPNNASIR